tara:strand:- start:394 stop:897 length:504 start_codon:yes stop_codon:yes gene_type:complete
MSLIVHRFIIGFVFLLGIICFSFYSLKQDFFMGAIVLSLVLIFINIYAVITESLESRSMFHLFSASMVFVAVSVFGNYGVEQKPVGHQTLYHFNLQGVAISLVLFLLSSVFFIVGRNQNKNTPTQIVPAVKKTRTKKPRPYKIIESDDWQEASIEDIQSGQYQINRP